MPRPHRRQSGRPRSAHRARSRRRLPDRRRRCHPISSSRRNRLCRRATDDGDAPAEFERREPETVDSEAPEAPSESAVPAPAAPRTEEAPESPGRMSRPLHLRQRRVRRRTSRSSYPTPSLRPTLRLRFPRLPPPSRPRCSQHRRRPACQPRPSRPSSSRASPRSTARRRCRLPRRWRPPWGCTSRDRARLRGPPRPRSRLRPRRHRPRSPRPRSAPAGRPSSSPRCSSRPRVDPGTAALVVKGVTKSFGDTRAVDGIDLTVPAGTFYGLVGPNGAGKTTTLSMIAGLLRPDRGTIRVNGVDAASDPLAAKRLMGVLPDRLRTFDRLTGRQLLLLLRRPSRAALRRRRESHRRPGARLRPRPTPSGASSRTTPPAW